MDEKLFHTHKDTHNPNNPYPEFVRQAAKRTKVPIELLTRKKYRGNSADGKCDNHHILDKSLFICLMWLRISVCWLLLPQCAACGTQLLKRDFQIPLRIAYFPEDSQSTPACASSSSKRAFPKFRNWSGVDGISPDGTANGISIAALHMTFSNLSAHLANVIGRLSCKNGSKSTSNSGLFASPPDSLQRSASFREKPFAKFRFLPFFPKTK